MSFTGDLEHLPIVDVIQLLHATRKSGILRVKCRKGESQLIFKDGYMVSANHLNNSVRIGKILSDLNLVSPEILDQALQEQIGAGQNRKPLIITLLEKGEVKEEDAYKGLEQLIEMTIVEILTWKKGTFVLDILPEGIVDDYRYYPGKMGREINIDTQSVLMDALRIYDEKMRDGELHEEDVEDEVDLAGPEETAPTISADDLGLADFDRLEKKPPTVFKSLDEEDPCKLHSQRIEDLAPELFATERERLASFLGRLASASTAGEFRREGPMKPVIFFSSDELVSYSLTTVCKHAGIPVFATDEEHDVEPIIAQSLSRNSLPLLVLDAPKGSEMPVADSIASLLQKKKSRYPRMITIQLASASNPDFSLQSYQNGVSAVFPRPVRQQDEENFVTELIRFLEAFQSYLKGSAREQEHTLVPRLASSMKLLRSLTEPPQIATEILRFMGGLFDRAVTLIVRESEIIVEKSIGVKGEKSREIRPAMGVRIPIPQPSLLRKVIEEGRPFYGNSEDDTLKNQFFPVIGAPGHPMILLLPLLNRGKTVAITYADFGEKGACPVDMEALDILTAQAELVLENSIFRKKLQKNNPQTV